MTLKCFINKVIYLIIHLEYKNRTNTNKYEK